MSRTNAVERFARTVDHSDPKAEKDRKALHSLMRGGSVPQAAVASGWSVATIYRRGIVTRYVDWLDKRKPQDDPPSPERR